MYSQLGTKIIVAGIISAIIGHFSGAVINPDIITKFINDILTVGGDIAVIYGTIHQAFAHKQLAVETGTISA